MPRSSTRLQKAIVMARHSSYVLRTHIAALRSGGAIGRAPNCRNLISSLYGVNRTESGISTTLPASAEQWSLFRIRAARALVSGHGALVTLVFADGVTARETMQQTWDEDERAHERRPGFPGSS